MLAPIALLARFLHWLPLVVFAAGGLAIVPLAKWMGTATEELAFHVGPGIGGLLNASFGNAAELIITFFALRAGLIEGRPRSPGRSSAISSSSSAWRSCWAGCVGISKPSTAWRPASTRRR